jgi:hypothetical protein
VSPRLDEAIRRAMAKQPEDRFPTMDAFCAELEACLAELQAAGTQLVRPAVARPRPRHRARFSLWPLLLALVVLAAAAAVGAVLILRNDNGGGAGVGNGSGGAVHLRATTAYDPYGGDGEHDADAPKATDGNPSTYWTTESYRTAPGLGKPGVGLVLDAGKLVQLHHLAFTTSTPGLTAEVLAGVAPGGPFDAVVGASQTVAGGRADYTIANGRHRYYVIWITRLGDSFQSAHIDEVTAN